MGGDGSWLPWEFHCLYVKPPVTDTAVADVDTGEAPGGGPWEEGAFKEDTLEESVEGQHFPENNGRPGKSTAVSGNSVL